MARCLILVAFIYQALSARVSDQYASDLSEPSFCKNVNTRCSNFQVEKCPEKCGQLLEAYCTKLKNSKASSSSICNVAERRQCAEACASVAQNRPKQSGVSHVCKSIHGGCTEFQAERCPDKCATAYCNSLAVDLPLAGKICTDEQKAKCTPECEQVRKDKCDALGSELALTNKHFCPPADQLVCPGTCAKATCKTLLHDLPLARKVCTESQFSLCGEVCEQVKVATCQKVGSTVTLAKQLCNAEQTSMCGTKCAEVKSVHCSRIASFLTQASTRCDATQLADCAEECAHVAAELADAPPEASKSCDTVTTYCNRFFQELCPIKCKKIKCGQMQQKHTTAGTKCNSRERRDCPQACSNAAKAECDNLGSNKTAGGAFCTNAERRKCGDVCAKLQTVSCNLLGYRLSQTGRGCTDHHRTQCPDSCVDVDSTFETEEEQKHVCTKIRDSCNFFQKQQCAKKCQRMVCDKLAADLQEWNQACSTEQTAQCPGMCAQLQESLGVVEEEDDLDDMAFCKSVKTTPCGAFHQRECPRKCTKLKCVALQKTLVAQKRDCNGAQRQLCPKQCKSADFDSVCETLMRTCTPSQRRKCSVRCAVLDRR